MVLLILIDDYFFREIEYVENDVDRLDNLLAHLEEEEEVEEFLCLDYYY